MTLLSFTISVWRPWPISLLFIFQIVVFHFNDHMAIPLYIHHKSEKIHIFLLPSSAVYLMVNSAAITLACCDVFRVPSSVIAIPCPGLQDADFYLFFDPSVVDKPSLKHALIKCYNHSIESHSLIGASLRVGWSGLQMEIIGNWAISLVQEGTDPFATTSWTQRNSHRYHFHSNIILSVA